MLKELGEGVKTRRTTERAFRVLPRVISDRKTLRCLAGKKTRREETIIK